EGGGLYSPGGRQLSGCVWPVRIASRLDRSAGSRHRIARRQRLRTGALYSAAKARHACAVHFGPCGLRNLPLLRLGRNQSSIPAEALCASRASLACGSRSGLIGRISACLQAEGPDFERRIVFLVPPRSSQFTV